MLSRSVTDIKGIGPAKAEALRKEVSIETVEDLLYYIPRRYVDRSSFRNIRDCFVNETVSVSGIIQSVNLTGKGKKRLEVIIDDGTESLAGVFFAGINWFRKIFHDGDTVIFAGKINFYRQKQIVHPDFDFMDTDSQISAINTGRIVPLYHSTEKLKGMGLDSRGFRKIIKNAIDLYLPEVSENLTADITSKHGLMEIRESLRAIHFPENFEEASGARRRLAFNEIFFLSFYIFLSKEYVRLQYGTASPACETSLSESFIKALPFELTEEQAQAVRDIKNDMLSPFPMNRLLQGDVGTGKTVVALATAMIPIASGKQVAFMAPTEVLAVQHFRTIEALVPQTVKTALLTGSTPAERKKEIYRKISEGTLDCVVGTHALIQETVAFKNMGYAIIDEQHRFGVEQRAGLRKKGEKVDLLIMTATPIPRSLSMTVFGDLDVSSIRKRPSDRLPVETLAFPESRLPGVYNSMEKYLKQGRQIFYVLPLIEDSEKIDLKSAVTVYENLKNNIFKHRSVALLHGRLKQNEKDEIMESFRDGAVNILVSTTVIEVGIDVPNASVMVIHHAERFGLSQLHQLRGRVGRGEHKSFCVLVYPDDISDESRKRIDVLVSTSDGFVIAEEDLKLRGAGQLTGVKQHGYSELEFTDLVKDMDIISAARDEARLAVADIDNIEKALDNCTNRSYSGLIKGIRTKRVLEILS